MQAIAKIDQLVCDLEAATITNRTPGGRPPGRTVKTSKSLDDCKRKAFDNAATIFSKFKTRGRLPAGGLNKILKRAKLQNGLENEKDWTISANLVRS
jgi:hypothetical protein